MNKKILIVCSLDYSLINFRGDLIRSLLRNKYQVICAAPNIRKSIREELESLGVDYCEFPLKNSGLNPFKDLQSIYSLYRIIKENKIDLVFPYTIKPVLYSSYAAGLQGVPVYSLITGLGFTFSATSAKAKILQKVSEAMYRVAMKYNKMVIFQNEDDRALFISKNIISADKPSAVVNGSGINLDRFQFTAREKQPGDPIRFLMVTRILAEKGVGFFIDAARILRTEYPLSEFHIVGYSDQPESSPLSTKALEKLHTDNVILFHGSKRNIPEIMANMDVFVLPTYYREGVPRSILEALSSGMPVITTDTPGCRETVVNNKNGFLIPPQESAPVLEAMRYFLENPIQITKMGRESNILAKEKFDVHKINQEIIQLLN